MKQVIFDSSFLMAVGETPTTWFEDIVDALGSFQPALPSCVKAELDKIAKGQGRRSRAARVALDLASKFLEVKCGRGAVDDEIISAALSLGAPVATVDAELARSLKAAHVRVVSLRSGRVSVA